MKSFPTLSNLEESLVQYYACLSTRKFFFFLDPMKTGKISITTLLSSPILAELLTMEEPDLSDDELVSNWFSPLNFHRIYSLWLMSVYPFISSSFSSNPPLSPSSSFLPSFPSFLPSTVNYLELDRDEDGLLSQDELLSYAGYSYTQAFISRVFQEFHTFEGKMVRFDLPISFFIFIIISWSNYLGFQELS